jgi:hypothetical protein
VFYSAGGISDRTGFGTIIWQEVPVLDVIFLEMVRARAEQEFWAPSVSAYMEELHYPSEPATSDLGEKNTLRARAMLVHSE